MHYIYAIQNLVNDKKYIGSTKSIKNRKYEHFNQLKKGIHHSEHLQKSYNKYGKDSFIFYIIEECTISERKEKELYHINVNKSFQREFGYNIYEPNEANFKCSESTKQKIINSKKHLAKEIDMYDLSGNLISSYRSIHDCCLKNNFQGTSVSEIVNGKRKSYKGFTFKFKGEPFDYVPSSKQRNMTKFYKI